MAIVWCDVLLSEVIHQLPEGLTHRSQSPLHPTATVTTAAVNAFPEGALSLAQEPSHEEEGGAEEGQTDQRGGAEVQQKGVAFAPYLRNGLALSGATKPEIC